MRKVVKSVLANSCAMRAAFGCAAYCVGRPISGIGRLYDAASIFALATRHTDDKEIWGERHRRVLRALIQNACYREGRLMPHSENRLLASYNRSKQAKWFRRFYAAQPFDDRIRLRKHREDGDEGRQGSLMILKQPNVQTGEKGVIIQKYQHSFLECPAVFYLPELTKRYRFVLEPSTSNYIEPCFPLYLGFGADILVLCPRKEDEDELFRLIPEFNYLRLGSGNWTDSDMFCPPEEGCTKRFDLVMVAGWASCKRHEVLFEALARLRPERPSVALVGFPLEFQRKWIENLARKYGVLDQCEIIESVPPAQVVELLQESKVSLLLSAFEGSNKAIYEGFFCDVPAIVYRYHIGIDISHINSETGILADDDELPDIIRDTVSRYESFSPRRWAMAHTGYHYSTQVINRKLREMAESHGESWTQDIVPKINRPNLRYQSEEDRIAMESSYVDLASFLSREK